ncbi:MAG: transcription regulator with HTH domain [Bacteroidetes bacterium]|nr:MAG: transcription regulator with HTH domain [Bacteroidota bacterium]
MIRPIRTLHNYRVALHNLLRIMDAPKGSAQAKQAEVLFVLLRDFERSFFPPSFPDPVEAIRYRMNQLGLVQRDMVPYFGSESRASEVLGRQRKMTVKMIAALHYGLGIPFGSLIVLPAGSARRLGKIKHDPVARLASLRLQLEPKRKPGRPRKHGKKTFSPRRKKGSLALAGQTDLPGQEERDRLKELIRLWHNEPEQVDAVEKSPVKKKTRGKRKPTKTKKKTRSGKN